MKEDQHKNTISGTGPEFDELAVAISEGEFELRDALPEETKDRIDSLFDALIDQTHALGPIEVGSVEFEAVAEGHWFNVLEVGAFEADLSRRGREKTLEVQELFMND
ncbi:hypothetical protein [Halocatena halophila]|uniref:hypothetical protein n=1 Tax=Halocatena halophila TaxID=2814576 RepID=UPI002ED0CB42